MNHTELVALKKQAGKEVFTSRVRFDGNLRAPCPFHGGNDGFTLWPKDGEWFATCRSGCKGKAGGDKTWDAIAFVQEHDRLSFNDAVAKLLGKPVAASGVEKPAPKRMTESEWQMWGRKLCPADIERLSKSRKDKTASFETFQRLGCRVKNDVIAFPYTLTTFDVVAGAEVKFFTVKTRHLDTKELRHEHCIDGNRFYNLDTVNAMEPVYVVEGEPDVAIMEEAGFRTVGVPTSGKFSDADLEILCEAEHIFLIGDQKKRGENDPGPALIGALQAKCPPQKTSRITLSEAHDACQLAIVYGDAFAGRIERLSGEAQVPWVSKNVRTVSKLSRDDPKWIVERMIPWGGLTIFCGKQGAEKTLLAEHLAKAVSFPISCDFKFLGREIYPHRRREVVPGIYAGARDVPVLYIDRENPESEIARRLRWMGLLGCDNFFYWGDGDSEATPKVNDPRLEDWMRKERGLIIFDSLQDWYGDASEIDNSAMVELMHGFRRLARLGAGVVVLHHDAKYGDSGFRGATGIVAIPEMSIGIRKSEGDPEVLELRQIRFRMCKNWELDARIHWDDENHTIKFTTERDEHGMTLYNKQQAAQQAKQDEKEARLDGEAARLEVEVLKAPTISANALEGVTEKSGAKIGRNRIPSLLARRGWERIDGTWQKKDAAPEQLPFEDK